jgi:hypothetical protein
MSESNDLFKIVVFIGLVLFFSTIVTQPWVYVGQPIPPDSTWGQFAAQAGAFPVFTAPNNAGALQHLYVDGDFWATNLSLNVGGQQTVNALGPSAVGACVNQTAPIHANYYGCLTTLDAAASYIQISTNSSKQPTFTANVSSPTGGPNILIYSITAIIQCHQEYGTVLPLNVTLNIVNATGKIDVLEPVNPGTSCPVASWGMETYTWDLSGFTQNQIQYFSHLAIRVQAMDVHQTVDVSYARVDFVPSNQAICSGDIGCELGNAVWGIINFFVLIGTGIVFVFQVLFWFIGMVAVFFTGLGSIFSLPGTPPILSALFGVLIIGLLFFVALVFMGKVRGTGNTG